MTEQLKKEIADYVRKRYMTNTCNDCREFTEERVMSIGIESATHYAEKAEKLAEALREIIETGKDWGWDENFWATNIANQSLRDYEGEK